MVLDTVAFAGTMENSTPQSKYISLQMVLLPDAPRNRLTGFGFVPVVEGLGQSEPVALDVLTWLNEPELVE